MLVLTVFVLAARLYSHTALHVSEWFPCWDCSAESRSSRLWWHSWQRMIRLLLLPECLCSVWLSPPPFIPSFEKSWKPHVIPLELHQGSRCVSPLWPTGRKTRGGNLWQKDEIKATGVESVGLADAQGFLSVISGLLITLQHGWLGFRYVTVNRPIICAGEMPATQGWFYSRD